MSHPSEYGRLRFCPKCGTEKIARDYFPGGSPAVPDAKQPKVGCEYVCETCGFGFWISKSRRVLHAELHFARNRKRAPVKFTEACVGTEVARLYLSQSEPPIIRTLKSKVSALFKRKTVKAPEPLWPHRDDLAERKRCKCADCLKAKALRERDQKWGEYMEGR